MSETTFAPAEGASPRRRVRAPRVLVGVALAVLALLLLVVPDGGGLTIQIGGPAHVVLFGLSVWFYRWAAHAPADSPS